MCVRVRVRVCVREVCGSAVRVRCEVCGVVNRGKRRTRYARAYARKMLRAHSTMYAYVVWRAAEKEWRSASSAAKAASAESATGVACCAAV